MTFDFDGLRLDWLHAKPGRKWRQHEPALAAWIADMDFEPAPVITAALASRLESGDLGYPNWGGKAGRSPAVDAFVAWQAARHGWRIEAEDVREWSDVVQAIQAILHVSTRPGDRVVVHTPAYPPFFAALEATGTELLAVPAERRDGRWTWDHRALDERLKREPARVLLLCNPHNPTGRCLDERELREVLAVAERHDMLIIADEIHADLVHAPRVHVPIGSLDRSRVVTLTSASKAFIVAGLHYAVSHVGSAQVASALNALPERIFGEPGMPGVLAAHTAWTEGEPWLDAVRAHLRDMRDLTRRLVDEHLPGVTMIEPEATYLAWLDCSATAIADDPAAAFERVGVAVNPGRDFGPDSAGFVRLNFATSRDVLTRIVTQMSSALR
jgi:cystathionine beta-lyase